MSAQDWRTGNIVHAGALTLDPERAREKLRDYKLADPHQWILEIVAAANIAKALRVSIDLDSDEFLIKLHNMELTQEDIESLWQAPFVPGSRPELRRLAFALIAADVLNPRQIIIRSQGHEASLGPSKNRNLLERLRTSLYPDDHAFDGTQIYLRLPLESERVFSRAQNLPEFRHLVESAKYSAVRVDVAGERITAQDFGATKDAVVFDRDGMRGAVFIAPELDGIEVTFISHGIATEKIKSSHVIPCSILLETDRVEYDLSGMRIVRNDSLRDVLQDLESWIREALIQHLTHRKVARRMHQPLMKFTRDLLAEVTRARRYFEDVPESSTQLLDLLRDVPMWICAGTAPPDAPPSRKTPGLVYTSLKDACPEDRIVNRATQPFEGRFGDRPALWCPDDVSFATEIGPVPRHDLENGFQIQSRDVTEQAQMTRKRVMAEAAWRASPWSETYVLLNSTLESASWTWSQDRKITIIYAPHLSNGRCDVVHQNHILRTSDWIPHLYVAILDVNASEDFTGAAPDSITVERADTLLTTFVEFLRTFPSQNPISAISTPAVYQALHRFAWEYAHDLESKIKKVLADIELPRSPELADIQDVPLFSQITEEALNGSTWRMLKSVVSDSNIKLISFSELGEDVLTCTPREAERLIVDKSYEYLNDHVTVIATDDSNLLIREFIGRVPGLATTTARTLKGKHDFEMRPKSAFKLSGNYLKTRRVETSTGVSIIGILARPDRLISVEYFHDDRVVDRCDLRPTAGSFEVVSRDSRLTMSAAHDSFLPNAGRTAHEQELVAACQDMAFEFVDAQAPTFDSDAALLFQQFVGKLDDRALKAKWLVDVDGQRRSIHEVRQRKPTYLVVEGEKPLVGRVPHGAPIVVLPAFLPSTVFPNAIDVSDTPAVRRRHDKAKEKFLARQAVEPRLQRPIEPASEPSSLNAYAVAKVRHGAIHGEVGLIGLRAGSIQVTLLHKKRPVGQRFISVPFGEFEAVVEYPDLLMDPLMMEIQGGEEVADEAIKQACGECLLSWMLGDEHHSSARSMVVKSMKQIQRWSDAHVEAARRMRDLAVTRYRATDAPPANTHSSDAKQAPKDVSIAGPDVRLQRLERLMDEVRGDAHIFGNVAFRGFRLKELGTGLPAQADGGWIDADPSHPTIELALKTDDLIWHAMAVSTSYTALNLRWLAITDDHEEEFHARMLAYFAESH